MLDTVQQVAYPQKPKQRIRPLVLIAGLALLLCGIFSGALIGYQTSVTQYHQDMSLANDGVQHLQRVETLVKGMAQHPFDMHGIENMHTEFVGAESDFSRLQSNMQMIPEASTYLPVYGGKLHAAFALVPAALDASHAGVIGCNVLQTVLPLVQNPLNSKGQGLTPAEMASVETNAQQVVTSLSQALNLLSQVKPSDVQFNAKLSTLLATMQLQLPVVRQWLNSVQQLLPVLPSLLGIGTPTSYLIEMLDSSELRPGGGFIGNYGIATLSGERLTSAHITDVDLLDRPYEAQNKTIAFPPAYSWFPLVQSWSFRDSDLDADFPTSARYGEQNYHIEGGNVPVQGVIAFTPTLIQNALTLTGPIYIPEYQETITSENIIARIHYHQLGAAGEGPDTIASPDGHSSLRKRFTELLSEDFLARIHQLPSSALPKMLQVLMNGVRTKDLQLYFNNSSAETMLHLAHVDDTIASPSGDSLMVVDANVSPNKANSFIQNTMSDQITIDAQGNAVYSTTLTYAWTIPGIDYGNPLYRDYVRIYVPPDAVLNQESGLARQSVTSAFGRKVLGGFLYLSYSQKDSITLNWTVPHVAVKDAQGMWHYQDEIQRQAGILRTMSVQITLPDKAVMKDVQGGLQRQNGREVSYAGVLNEDKNIGVSWNL